MAHAKVGHHVVKKDRPKKPDTLSVILSILREQKARLDQVVLQMEENSIKRAEGQAERKAEAAEIKQMITEFKTHYKEMKETYDFIQALVARMQRWGRPLLWGLGILLSCIFSVLKIIDWIRGHK